MTVGSGILLSWSVAAVISRDRDRDRDRDRAFASLFLMSQSILIVIVPNKAGLLSGCEHFSNDCLKMTKTERLANVMRTCIP